MKSTLSLRDFPNFTFCFRIYTKGWSIYISSDEISILDRKKLCKANSYKDAFKKIAIKPE